MKFNDFNDYLVILHNHQKRDKRRRIRKCVSKQAAAQVADIKERIEGSLFRASLVYVLDSEGNPQWDN